MKKEHDLIDFCIGYCVAESDFSTKHDLFDCYQMFIVLKEYCNNNMERTDEDEDYIMEFLWNTDFNKLWEEFKLYGWDAVRKG